MVTSRPSISVSACLCLGKGPLGIEQGKRIHLAFALLGADDLRRDLGLVARGGFSASRWRSALA